MAADCTLWDVVSKIVEEQKILDQMQEELHARKVRRAKWQYFTISCSERIFFRFANNGYTALDRLTSYARGDFLVTGTQSVRRTTAVQVPAASHGAITACKPRDQGPLIKPCENFQSTRWLTP